MTSKNIHSTNKNDYGSKINARTRKRGDLTFSKRTTHAYGWRNVSPATFMLHDPRSQGIAPRYQ